MNFAQMLAQGPRLSENTTDTKMCRDCLQTLPLSEFYFRNREQLPCTRCKKCESARVSAIARARRKRKQDETLSR